MNLRHALHRLHYQARRLRRLPVTLGDDAFRIETLCPPEPSRGEPAVFLEGELEKARNPAFGTLEAEVRKVRGEVFTIGPTQRLTLRDAALQGLGLYHGGRRLDFRFPPPADLRPGEVRRVGRAVAPSSYIGCNFFGHWLTDDCGAHLLAQDEVGQGASLFTVHTPAWADKPRYARLLGQDWSETTALVADEVVLFRDIAHNSHKTARSRRLRALVRERVGRPDGGAVVYVPRGGSGHARPLLNEPELVAALERRGAVVFPPEAGATLAETHPGCRIVISVEGSQLAHGLHALRDGGGLLAIQPPWRFYNAHLDWAQQLGLHYALIVGDPAPEGNGMGVDIDRLMRTLDLLERRTGP